VSHHILIIYGTRDGQTAKIARFVADELRGGGDSVVVANAAEPMPEIAMRDYDGVIVGSSVIVHRHRRTIQRFVTRHGDALNAMPSAFFSVSGAAASRIAGERAAAQQIVERFLRRSGWRPVLSEAIGGAMAFTKYSPLLRWWMVRISRRNGGPTDPSRDHELTDWEQVRRFARAFAATISRWSPGEDAVTA
jgi:menaquinone-dependent protoporphyrinogen oxidase